MYSHYMLIFVYIIAHVFMYVQISFSHSQYDESYLVFRVPSFPLTRSRQRLDNGPSQKIEQACRVTSSRNGHVTGGSNVASVYWRVHVLIR